MMISNGWISADEKVPEERQRVLGIWYCGNIPIVAVMIYKDGEFLVAWDFEKAPQIAFWLPMPALPEFLEDSED